jgi:hypothetical protein
MRMREYNEMTSILFFSQQPVALERQPRWKLGEGGSILGYQPSA